MTDDTENVNNRWWSGTDPLSNLDSKKRKAYDLWKNPSLLELYDLQNDRWEWNNLADNPEYQDIQERLLTKLQDWQQETGDELRHPQKLERFKREVESTFIDGVYVHLNNQPEFEWQYIEYLRPNSNSDGQN